MVKVQSLGRGFLGLFTAQGLSAFGDNILRNAAAVLVVWTAHAPSWLVAVAAAAFVAPTALLSGLGGELADRMDKGQLARRLKLAELPVAAVAAASLAAGSLPLAMAALAASGVLAALFGPLKYGILPELVASARVAEANAWVEGATFAAILSGSVGGTLLAAGGAGRWLAALLVFGAACLSYLATRRIPALKPGAPELRVSANVAGSTLALLRSLHADRRSWRAALGNAWFWTLGAVVLSLLPGLARDTLGAGPGMNAVFLGLFTVGVALGSATAAFLAGGRLVVLPAAIGSAISGASLLVVWALTAALPVTAGVGAAGVAQGGSGIGHAFQAAALDLALFLTAAGAGLIAVPTQAAIQCWAGAERRARAVGASNVLSALGMVAGTAALALAQRAGLHEAILLGIAGGISLALAPVMAWHMPANPLGELAWVLARLLFRVRLRGGENLPPPGEAALITPNHISLLDAAVIVALCEQTPHFVIDAEMASRLWVKPFLRLVPTVRVAAASPHSVRRMVAVVRRGAVLVIFPEGRISDTGALTDIQHGTATIADHAGAPVVPVLIEGLERTFFSRLPRSKTRRALFPLVTVTVRAARVLSVDASCAGKARRVALTAALRRAMRAAEE